MPKKSKLPFRSKDKSDKSTNLEDEDSLQDEKQLLEKQISQLNDLIWEIEFALNLTNYGNIENIDKLKAPVERKGNRKLKNINYILQHELYKLSGLYCSKCKQNEFVFNFSPFCDNENKPTYAIQFFTTNQKGTIGKYIMPASGMIETIIDETPIDKLTGLMPFFRNCRRHIECFVDRKEQYEEFRQSTSAVKNMHIDADSSYLLITCSFLQVHNQSMDNSIDITVYLSYDHGKTRPTTMNFDCSIKDKSTMDNYIKEMKSFVKVFRNSSLTEAYCHIKAFKHPVFAWQPEVQDDDDDELSDIHEMSYESQEEGRSIRKKRRAPRKRQRSLMPEKDGNEDKKKKVIQKAANEVKGGKKSKRGAIQTTLNFTKRIVKSRANATKANDEQSRRLIKALTSTPVHKNIQNKWKIKTPETLGLSPIFAQSIRGKTIKTDKASGKKK